MKSCRILIWLTNWPVVKFTVTVSPLVVMSPYGSPSEFSAALSLRSCSEYAMSAAENGFPSDHLTPSRAVIVSCVKSAFQVHDLASHGTALFAGRVSLT